MEANQATASPLKDALEKRGPGAQIELAKALDVNPSTIWRWANEGMRPHRRLRKQIARHFDMKERDLWPTN